MEREEIAGTEETIGVDIDNQFIPTMTEQINSENAEDDRPAPSGLPSTLEPPPSDEQRVPVDQPGVDQTTLPNGPLGSNPSPRTTK